MADIDWGVVLGILGLGTGGGMFAKGFLDRYVMARMAHQTSMERDAQQADVNLLTTLVTGQIALTKDALQTVQQMSTSQSQIVAAIDRSAERGSDVLAAQETIGLAVTSLAGKVDKSNEFLAALLVKINGRSQ